MKQRSSNLWQIFALFILSFYVFGFTTSDLAQSGLAKPLQIGNKWFYADYEQGKLSSKYAICVTGTTVVHHRVYAKMARYQSAKWRNLRYYERADSVRIYRYFPEDSSERITCDFSLSVGDSLGQWRVAKVGSLIFWGELRQCICFDYTLDYLEVAAWTYVKGIGLAAADIAGLGIGTEIQTHLIGAILDSKIYGDTLITTVSEKEPTGLPRAFFLRSFPNPFKEKIEIEYGFKGNRPKKIAIEILNILGENVANLFVGTRASGTYCTTWNGRNGLGEPVPAGIYFIRATLW